MLNPIGGRKFRCREVVNAWLGGLYEAAGFQQGTRGAIARTQEAGGHRMSDRVEGETAVSRKAAKIARHAALLILAGGIVCVMTACFLTASPSAAKEYRGNCTLTGVVIGPDDKPVARAVITYQSSAGIAPHAVRTDSTGHFTIRKLAADNYDFRASAKGLFSDWEKNVSLRKGETKSVTLRLIYTREPLKPQQDKPAKQSP
jgi:hypothetical protein